MHKYLELHFAQLQRAWEISITNIYSDPSKNHYHQQLGNLFKQIKQEKFSNLNKVEIPRLKK